MFSTCVTTASSLTKPNNAFATTSGSLVMSVDSTMYICSTAERIEADG